MTGSWWFESGLKDIALEKSVWLHIRYQRERRVNVVDSRCKDQNCAFQDCIFVLVYWLFPGIMLIVLLLLVNCSGLENQERQTKRINLNPISLNVLYTFLSVTMQCCNHRFQVCTCCRCKAAQMFVSCSEKVNKPRKTLMWHSVPVSHSYITILKSLITLEGQRAGATTVWLWRRWWNP